MTISKSDYMRFRECAKNAWMKIHRPLQYKELDKISIFQQMLLDGGNEVDVLARELFPSGVFIDRNDSKAKEITAEHINKKTQVLFQAMFENEGFHAEVDILEYNPLTNSYTVYEVKSKTKVDEKKHYHDLAFQVNLLRMCGLQIDKAIVMHLNKEYKRNGSLNKLSLFKKEDVTEKVEQICEVVKSEMYEALNFLSQDKLTPGFCECVYKGRSSHCVTFSLLNPDIPAYSIHDISRIGQSPKKLVDLIDSGIYSIEELPPLYPLSATQQNQVDAHNSNIVIVDRNAISTELEKLEFPLYFIDYETLGAAIPRFDGYSPYQHIPFQYSLYVLETPTSEPELLEFIHTENSDPCRDFVESMQKHIGEKGSIIVWYEPFERSRNEDIAKLVTEMSDTLAGYNKRIYDLRDIFAKQLYVHKDFLGKTSIKNVLPVLVPSLSYKELDIRDGGMASEAWNKLMTEELPEEEKQKIIQNLKKYCGLDAYAMYAIWKELQKITISTANINPISSSYVLNS